jgi:hypothetical protein
MLFHNQLGDQTQFIMFMKNVAIAGGSFYSSPITVPVR